MYTQRNKQRWLHSKIAICFVVACVSATTTGCCAWRTRGRAFGRIEAFVIITAKKCNCPAPEHTFGLEGQIEKPLTVFAREVFSSRLREGIPNRTVKLSVVDATGDTVSADVASVAPMTFQTDSRGFGPAISIVSHVQQVVRIRAEYLDKRATSVSYSMPIWFH
jgi:hypothetical protein